MSNKELNIKFDRLLRIFCEQEARRNKDVPDEVTEYVLGSLVDFVLPGLETGHQDPRLEETDFLDRFEKFILAQPKETTRTNTLRRNKENVPELEQAVAEILLSKNIEAEKLKQAYQRVIEQRNKTQNKFEDVVVSESLHMDVSDLKMQSIRKKSLNQLYREKPGMEKALKKLKNLIEEELRVAEKHIVDLEDAETANQALERNQEHQKLLGEYKQLLMEKNSLELG